MRQPFQGAGSQNQERKKRKTKYEQSSAARPLKCRKRAQSSASEDRSSQSPQTAKIEKRLASYVARPSKAISERIERAFEHRLYLIAKKPMVGDDPDLPSACKFVVLGNTGFVYSVRLDLRPSCTCPDFKFRRGNTCKHILFVMLRVLKLHVGDPRAWQKALLKSELHELLRLSSANDEAAMASHAVRARYTEIPGSSPRKEEEEKRVQRDLEGDCPVCYESLEGAKEDVVFCRVCGNNVHRDCFIRWSSSKRAGTVTCVYCRAPWEDEGRRKRRRVARAM